MRILRKRRKCLALVLCVFSCIYSGCMRRAQLPEESAPPLQSIPENSAFEPINPFAAEGAINAHNIGDTLRMTSVTAAAPIQLTSEKCLPDTSLIETELLSLINAEREKRNIALLESDSDILWAAQIRAVELLDNFTHTRPDGEAYYTVFAEADFNCAGKWHGENIATMSFEKGTYDERRIAGAIFNSLAESEGNYSNMLREQYALVGVGVSVGVKDDGKVHISTSQLFAGK